MRKRDGRVPPEVEDFLVGSIASAGALGGSIGGAVGAGGAGAAGGKRGGARGGAGAAARMRTVVADRSASAPLDRGSAWAAISAAFPKAGQLPADDSILRVVIPLGRTGLQQIVADVAVGTHPPHVPSVRAYGKEGLLNRKPTARIADGLLQALGG